MKKILFLLVSLMLFTSCNETEEPIKIIVHSENIEPAESIVEEVYLDLDTIDVKTSYANMIAEGSFYLGALNIDKFYISSVKHLPIFKFDTYDSFEKFKVSNGKEFDFTQEYDEIKSFEEESQAYDEDYFEDKTLFLIYVPSNSGSLRYGVNSIYSKDEYFSVHIEQINNPEIFTDDMVWWFITFGVDKSIIEDKEYFDADLNNF